MSKNCDFPLLLGLAIFLSLGLHCIKLDDIFLWADEGYTVFFARSVLRFGIPMADDGFYRFCANIGVTPSGVYVFHPWLQYYVAAVPLALFGTSIFFLRLPFVILGVLCIPLLYTLAKRIRLSQSQALIASFLLAANVPFILLNRNVRYYVFGPFFTLLLLIYYVDMRQQKRLAWIGFALTSAFFIYGVQPICLAIWAALLLHALVYERKKGVWVQLISAIAVSGLANIPFFIFSWSTILGTFGKATHRTLFGNEWLGMNWIIGTCLHLVQLVRQHFPTLLIPVAIFLKVWKKRPLSLKQDSIVMLSLCILSVCATLAYIFNTPLYLGYVIAAVPLLLLLAVFLFDIVAGKNQMIWAGLVVVFLFSNVFNLPSWPWKKEFLEDQVSIAYAPHKIRPALLKSLLTLGNPDFLLLSYLRELRSNYEGPVEGIVGFLRKNASSRDTFFATNDQEAIHVFTGLERVQALPFHAPPTWIIPRGGPHWNRGVCPAESAMGLDFNQYVNDFLMQNPYELIELPYPDFPHENMPVAPFHHRWGSAHYLNRRRVVLFHYKPNT